MAQHAQGCRNILVVARGVYGILRRNACILVDLVGVHLDHVLWFLFTGKTEQLQADAVASTASARKIRRRRDHKRGIRRASNETVA